MQARYVIRRVGQAVITFLSGMFFTYALYRLMPGGPVQSIKAELVQRAAEENRSPNPERINRLTEMRTGINPGQGIFEGFVSYLVAALNGDFGTSILYSEPVFDVIFRAMPWTVFISIYGFFAGFLMTIFFGTIMAYKEGTKIDKGMTVLIMVLTSVPYYVVAIILLVVLGFQWELLPTGGRYPSTVEPGYNLDFMIGIVKHAAMPIGSGLIVGFGGGAISMRALGIRVIGADYIRSARIRGLKRNRILTRYIARNTILPIYTGLMIGLAGLFSGAVILEQIFQYPGVGWYLLVGVNNQDYPLIMGSFILLVGITILGILIADFTYGLVDPRAGDPAEREAY